MPIASTSDKVLGAALASCELAWGVAKDTAEYAANTRAGRLASGGADLALGGVEKVVEFLLPSAKEDSGIYCWGAGRPALGRELTAHAAWELARGSQGAPGHYSGTGKTQQDFQMDLS